MADAATKGDVLLGMLGQLAERHGDLVTDVRGRGLMCAFTMPDAAVRDELLRRLRDDESVMMLGCGDSAVRFRPPLTVGVDELERGVAAIDRVLSTLAATDSAPLR